MCDSCIPGSQEMWDWFISSPRVASALPVTGNGPKFSEMPQDPAARTMNFKLQLLLLETGSLEMDFSNRDAMGRRCNYQQLSPSEQKWGELGSVTAA